MKTKFYLIYLFASISILSVDAQLRVVPFGKVEVGRSLTATASDPERLFTLHIIGPGIDGNAGKLGFGDFNANARNVFIGEYGTTDTDQLWLHGKLGTYITYGNNLNTPIAYYDPAVTTQFVFNTNLRVNGVTITSDERLKENICEISNPLHLLSQLNGINFNYKKNSVSTSSDISRTVSGGNSEKESRDAAFFSELDKKLAAKASQKKIGFIAQDVQKVLPELVEEVENGMLTVDYVGLIPVLVEGLKELQTLVEEQNIKIAMLEEVLGDQETIAFRSGTPMANQEIDSNKAALYQNTPNPFNIETRISYQLPTSCTNATLTIYNLSGQQVKKYDLDKKSTQLTISAGEFNAGMYIYTLIVDGQKINSKRMLITK